MASAPFPTNTNLTRLTTVLTLEALDISPSSAFAIFACAVVTYCFILFIHSVLLTTFVVKRTLHEPMYVLLFNMSLFDVISSTAFYPHLLCTVWFQRREISYLACATQGFMIHLCGTGSLLLLTVMAYDRYLAICMPLRYHSLMTRGTLAKLIFTAWGTSFTIIGILFTLTLSKEICRTNIVDTFCNNPSIMKLSCEDLRAVNYYGLFTIALVQGTSILVVSLSYIQILITCLSTKQGHSIRKAMQTCGTHLVVFLTYEVNTFLVLISHRLESASPISRRACGVSIIVLIPILNPLVYGLETREIRQTIFKFFERKISSV